MIAYNLNTLPDLNMVILILVQAITLQTAVNY